MTTRRIFFGADSGPMSLVSQTIASVKQAALTTEEKQQILSGNGRKLMEAKGVKI
jgi:predicted TIM-barrel fold metal-dependent hydrolase